MKRPAADLGATPGWTLQTVLLPAASAGDRLERGDRLRDLDRRLRDQLLPLLRRRLRHRADRDLQRDPGGAAAEQPTRSPRSWSAVHAVRGARGIHRLSRIHARRGASLAPASQATLARIRHLEIPSGRLEGTWQAKSKLVDLVKRFGDVAAVDGINLEMPSGEFFSMLGPSGCGKTTTLRMIAGFEQPTEGQILLDGVDMAQHPAAQAQRQHRVPELRAVPAPDRRRQRRLRAARASGSAKAEITTSASARRSSWCS